MSSIHIFFLIIFIYLTGGILLLFILAVVGLIRKKPLYAPTENKNSIAVIIPAYKEDNVIVETAQIASQHNYSFDKFRIFVVADSLNKTTIDRLHQIPIEVITVNFENSTKARSLHAAMEKISAEVYEIVFILDADNIMEEGCLEQVNAAYQKGFRAIQCHRTAKNKQTYIATLDAVSEEINNNLFRKGPRAFKLSASLIGSGMAFRFSDLKRILGVPHILDNPGEDREIDMQLMKEKIIVEYLDDAIVLDEKVSHSYVFEKQRIRWLEAQLNHFRRFLAPDMKYAPRTFNYYLKFMQTLLLPRSLYILIISIILIVILTGWILKITIVSPSPLWWILMGLVFALSLLLSVPRYLYTIQTFKSVVYLPVLIISMVKALLKIKSKRKEFLHTPKTFTS